MAVQEIFGPKQTSRYSKSFFVDPGSAVVISSFNLACDQTNEIGEVTKKGDCAILHKLDLKIEAIMPDDGCTGCSGCILDHVDVSVANSEPVMICGEMWTHNSQNNLSILTVPGVYMFEFCDESAIGTALIQVERMPISQATMLPRPLIHGEY